MVDITMRGRRLSEREGEDREYTLYDVFMEAYLEENEPELVRDLAELAARNAESKYDHFVPRLSEDVVRDELEFPRRRLRLRSMTHE